MTIESTTSAQAYGADRDLKPRVLIEDWLPAAAIGVECMRERGSASALAPHTYLHVWWARRPLTAARAAVLGSLLPASFSRDAFERLIGFGRPGSELVRIRRVMDAGVRVPGGFGVKRAFLRALRPDDLELAESAIETTWGSDVSIIDPMAGGGSIPLEAARLGLNALANEYNPVACSILEATTDYPLRYGTGLAERVRHWGRQWLKRIEPRLSKFYPMRDDGLVHAYIYARTVPCPETGFDTPLVPDWTLLKAQTGLGAAAEPVVDRASGTWDVRIRDLGEGRGHLKQPPPATYKKGKGVSLFTGTVIPADYIKAKAQAGQMGIRLYAIAVKAPQGLKFVSVGATDTSALEAAQMEVRARRDDWGHNGLIPTEPISPISNYDRGHRLYGIQTWAEFFAPRQLLAMAVLVEEFRGLSREIVATEGAERGRAVAELLALALDKFANHNCVSARFETSRLAIKGIMSRHGYAFVPAFAEMAPCSAGGGLQWSVDNVVEAFSAISELPRSPRATPPVITLGSATALATVQDKSLTAVVVDPPYGDNVQYAEVADFFYVWLKRTMGSFRPEWFASLLCDRDQEAVTNRALAKRTLNAGGGARQRAGDATKLANQRYQLLMEEAFGECRRVLRDDGVLTVMFTHKKQEAWEALFSSLIRAGFTITATWPVKTESEHSLHQAKQNAAQSTVILVARKRDADAGTGYFDRAMQTEIRRCAESAADRLQKEGLNAVDQLVGSFGPALEVYSRYAEVRTDTGEEVGVDRAIDIASDAVSNWRIQQLAARGLQGVEAEGRFALLCWDVLGAAEFRFNEAKLLGHAVGMDVSQLVSAGLVSRSSDKIKILSASDRRRDKAIEEVGDAGKGGRVHPNDVAFRTVLDACHALALRYVEAGGGSAGIGAARSLARQQGWDKDSPVARLLAALVEAAPAAVRIDRGKASAAAKFPEFRAWHALLFPIFGVPAPDWTEKLPDQMELLDAPEAADEGDAEDAGGDEDGEEDEEDED